MKYYVIETEYVGSNRFSAEDAGNIINGHYFHIQNVPGRTNMSGEEQTEGWLGTSVNWFRMAHGKFDDKDTAIDYIKSQCDGDRIGTMKIWDEETQDVVAVPIYYVSKYESVWDVGGYLHKFCFRDMDPRETDDDLRRLAEDVKNEVEAEKILLVAPGHDPLDLFEYLRELRDEACLE